MRIRISRRAAVMALGGVLLGVVHTLLNGDGLRDLGEMVSFFLIVVAAALLHELGHAVMAWGCGVPIKALHLDIFGARMELCGMLSYKRELAVAAGGPFFNLLSAAFALPFCYFGSWDGRAELFLAASVCLGGLNLLPVQGLDGGRMLGCTLSSLFGVEAGDRVVRLTTALCLGALWLLSVYALLRVGQMLTLFTFTLCLLLRLLIP